MNAKIENIQKEIVRRAISFHDDNPNMVLNLHNIETIMLIGASIILENQTFEPDPVVTPEGEALLRQLFQG